MCKKDRSESLKGIAHSNRVLMKRVIKYINNKLKVELYENNITKELKSKSYYKQVINRLFNLIESYSMKLRLLLTDIEKGQKLLTIKKALTVKSPAMSDGSFGNPNPSSQEKLLIAIGEETNKQKERVIRYDKFEKEFEDTKELIKQFIELSPRTPGVEVGIRHFLEGQQYNEIAKMMNYEQVYTIWKRAADDLALILMYAL